jgi:hypothetical protein
MLIAVAYVVSFFITVVLLHRLVGVARIFLLFVVVLWTRELVAEFAVETMDKLVGVVVLNSVHHFVEGDENIVHAFVVTFLVAVLGTEGSIRSKHNVRECV